MPKSLKNKSSSSPKPHTKSSSRLRKPFTPLRRFFFKLELLAPSPSIPALLGKRRREDLSDNEAGFEHLHAYNHTAAVDRALDSRQGNSEANSSAPISVYAPDGSRSWTKKPAGPRSIRALRGLAPTALTLPKKPRSQSASASSCTTPRPSHYTRRQGSARVALQNIDAALDGDAVIITALETIPFNSHEDLLAMSREELIHVAQTLNAKLPKALSIDTSNQRPISFIRNAIEVLVGIRPEVPAAPLRMGLKMSERYNPRFFEEFSFEKKLEEMDHSTPSATALSMRVKPRAWSADLHEMLRVPRRLDRLDELTEEETSRDDRGSWRKRRKLSSGNSSQELDSDVIMRNNFEDLFTPSRNFVGLPAGRSNQLHEVVPTTSSSSSRILRSHSQRLVDRATHVGGTGTLAGPLIPSEPKRNTNGKTERKPRPKYRRQTTPGCNKPSMDKIPFPTIGNSVSTEVSREQSIASRESNSPSETSSAGTTHSTDGIASSTMGKSVHQSEYSADNSGSAFLSIKSTFTSSSTSKMSVCTRSTRGSATVSKADAMSMGSVDMDISLCEL
ncbi:hypothetical protein AX15_002997 [Amanita polypyramis BW_CC]|nr:hypothetical protein AX15_002997 [Amanita polypyramis BW_CC]